MPFEGRFYDITDNYGKAPSYYIKTFGCQMNENDSEKIAGILDELGYTSSDDMDTSDLIVFNTCCVRESAEERIYGWIGELKELKEKNPGLIICICGCMSEQDKTKAKIKKSYPHVDIILGTNEYSLLPDLICRVLEDHIKIYDRQNQTTSIEIPYVSRKDKYKAYITIMKGCNNFCAYCIVPYVRGREASRLPWDILAEAENLARQGYIEITLLGQNVNSYGQDLGKKEAFSQLLERLCEIDGIERIRFMTSHPKDLSDSLIYAIRDQKKVCSSIHLPLQSGSTKVLSEMNRNYTKGSYLSLIDKLKTNIPEIAITTDIIVGFPGETEADFADTLDVIQKVAFDNAFMFKYSKRSGTKAALREDEVSREVIKKRFERLLELQNSISYTRNLKMHGNKYQVLAEGPSKHNKHVLTGRTESNKLVHFKGDISLIGKLVTVKINDVKSFSMGGVLTNE